jgi:biotin-(acetyl-CoA carboxylase) ligase
VSSSVVYLESCSSTQDEVKLRLRESAATSHKSVDTCLAPDFLWLRSDEQTNGRGRSGRIWESSETRNLYLSCGFRWSLEENLKPLLSLLAGLSAIFVLKRDILALGAQGQSNDATAESSPATSSMDSLEAKKIAERLFLKWPNDIFALPANETVNAMATPRKLGGVLAEAFQNFVVIGWGLNIFSPVNRDLSLKARATSLHEIFEEFEWTAGQKSRISNLSAAEKAPLLFRAEWLAQRLADDFSARVNEWHQVVLDHNSSAGDAYVKKFLGECEREMFPLWGLSGHWRESAAAPTARQGQLPQSAVAVGLNTLTGGLRLRLENGQEVEASSGEFVFESLSSTKV